MLAAVSIPTLQKCIDLLGESEGPVFHKLLNKSDFRSAPTLLDQINFIKEHKKDITVHLTIKFLGIHSKAYYKAIQNLTPVVTLFGNPPSRMLLKIEDELILIHEYLCLTQDDCIVDTIHHPPPAELWICQDTFFTMDAKNGLVYHGTHIPEHLM
ncbi:hypothetical protein M9Y10_009237 [Tritrichomonas musculus]|uniref:Uncharacterized protein n=1 Tax=Tritrichomonas musculus TaxID=1915356 RepID=A0ABR2IMQ9_9EUKA